MRHLLNCLLLASLILTKSAAAQDFDKGREAYYAGNFALALEELRNYSGVSEVAAAFFLGQIYREGKGVEADLQEAAYWYRKSSEAGHIMAPFYLGEMSLKGEGVPQDEAKGFYWWCVSGKRNFNLAQELLVSTLQPGSKYESSCPEIIAWRKKSADQAGFIEDAKKGDPEAEFQLAEMYYWGKGGLTHGIKKNPKEAAKWYRRAAEAGHTDAQFKLATMYYHGPNLGGPFEVDYREAFNWFLKSAAGGDVRSQKWLSMFYRDGLGVIKDPVRSLMWLHVVSSAPPKSERSLIELDIRRLALELTPAQLAEALEKAKSCLKSDLKNCA